MRGETKIVRLESGAQIAVAEYGDPEGAPIFFCHGWPSSRTMAEITDTAACDLGLRIISPDRPGIRGSSFMAKRKLLDWPPVIRHLADEMHIGQFRVLGISGGAPYAYATAWALPERVKAIAVVSGAPPIAELETHGDLLKMYRWMLALRESHPRLLAASFRIARPFVSVKLPIRLRPLLLKLLQPCDADVLRETRAFESCFESARQAWGGAARGVMADAEIYATPWGFPLEEIQVPVRLWHGIKDRTFSYRLAEGIAARLPHCAYRTLEDEGHYSAPIRHMHEILADLVATPE
ncbi:MAG: alpha/beta hydrolase [Verrucomicrobiota bacterium]